MVVFVVGLAGIVQMLGGLFVYLVATTAFHEILAACAFGLGVLALGVAGAVNALNLIQRDAAKALALADETGKDMAVMRGRLNQFAARLSLPHNPFDEVPPR